MVGMCSDLTEILAMNLSSNWITDISSLIGSSDVSWHISESRSHAIQMICVQVKELPKSLLLHHFKSYNEKYNPRKIKGGRSENHAAEETDGVK